MNPYWWKGDYGNSNWDIRHRFVGTFVYDIPFFATRTRFGLWFRNLALRTMNFSPVATLFAPSVRDDFELPDYGM